MRSQSRWFLNNSVFSKIRGVEYIAVRFYTNVALYASKLVALVILSSYNSWSRFYGEQDSFD